MLLSAVCLAKSKSKTLLVKMVSQAGTGYTFNTKRSRLREKLVLLHYDPVVNKRVLFVEKKKVRSI
ncbi:39S ribosomal protein L33, mitochondrial isoform X2 [Antechinus flavipes]|uniref:Large ribosomal subunit protein bL33m n=1 Tax=Sarcophilus harrisii TaxID=9305 RepID=A0A7N4PUY1_SARHA|nr:39S ribosomal protein L33, mitochondrial isoform X2 [Sarcophilus harrisii]XP_051832192.1 39S ribosomal protein L33, mitochondrial isoform X2 [Antechinus flavipes]